MFDKSTDQIVVDLLNRSQQKGCYMDEPFFFPLKSLFTSFAVLLKKVNNPTLKLFHWAKWNKPFKLFH